MSFVNFTGCDLSNADLGEVNALGTRFNSCTLTGACIENWNIDSRTELEGIICDFVYINLNPKVRNIEPNTGEFIRIKNHDKFDRVGRVRTFIPEFCCKDKATRDIIPCLITEAFAQSVPKL